MQDWKHIHLLHTWHSLESTTPSIMIGTVETMNDKMRGLLASKWWLESSWYDNWSPGDRENGCSPNSTLHWLHPQKLPCRSSNSYESTASKRFHKALLLQSHCLLILTCRVLTLPRMFSCDIAWTDSSLSARPSGMKILSWEKARVPIL